MSTHCRDFERAWSDRLDARSPWPVETGSAMQAHRSVCPACAALDSRYRNLEQALDALARVSPPPVPAGFADRVLAAVAVSDPGAPRVGVGGVLRLVRLRWAAAAVATAAAVVLLALGLGLPRAGLRTDPKPSAPTLTRVAGPVTAIDPNDLGLALAQATTATLSLARSASGPTARVGREVLAEADLPASDAAPALGLPDGFVPSGVFEGVGQRFNAGVRPFSGTARSAFGFLFAMPARTGATAPGNAPRGA